MSRIDRLEQAAAALMRGGQAASWSEAMARVGGSVEQIKAMATPPASVGPDVPVAPGRGAFVVFTHREFVAGSELRLKPAGHAGRQTLRGADVFDRMVERARSVHLRRGGDAFGFVPPLTPGQVQVGRDYRDMVERHSAGGVKCSSLEAQTGGGGGAGFMDAHIALGERIRAMRARVQRAPRNLAIRRLRPSATGARTSILDMVLIDMVCLRDMELGRVLKAHGWSDYGGSREALRQALAAALDRMQGYDRGRAQDVG